MADQASDPSMPKRRDSGAGLLTLGGVVAAFGLASCCALPLLLTTLGLGTAWIAGVGVLATPHRGLLTIIGAGGLFGGAVLLWRQQREAMTCGPDGRCMPAWVRALTLVGLLVGGGLLWGGYVYA